MFQINILFIKKTAPNFYMNFGVKIRCSLYLCYTYGLNILNFSYQLVEQFNFTFIVLFLKTN